MDRRSVQPLLGNDQAESNTRDLEQVNDDRLNHKNVIDFEKENSKTTALSGKKPVQIKHNGQIMGAKLPMPEKCKRPIRGKYMK
jgi:hypothetical protein